MLADPLINKGTAFSAREREALHLDGLVPPAVCTIEQQLDRVYRELPGEADADRAVHPPRRAPGPQRDAVLPPAARSHRGDDAGRLHAGGRRSVPEVLAHLPAAARTLHRLRAARPDRPDSREPSDSAGRDRRHRRRTDPRPRRSGRRRHGDSDRQAQPLHRVCRNPAAPDAADHARRRHRQRRAAERPAVSRHAAPPDSRRPLSGVRRSVRRRRHARVSAVGPAVGGLPERQRDDAARPLPRPAVHVQRRHPGHGGDRPRRFVCRAAHQRRTDSRPAHPARRRRRLGAGHCRPLRLRPARRRPADRGGAAPHRDRRQPRPGDAPTGRGWSRSRRHTRGPPRRWPTTSAAIRGA